MIKKNDCCLKTDMVLNTNKMEDKKEQIIRNLKILQNIETNKFKSIAYVKVIKALEELSVPVYTINDVEGVKGIGKGIHEKIVHILDHGYTDATKTYMQEDTNDAKRLKAIESFMQIMGIGPVKAKALVDQHNITTFEELAKNPKLLNAKQTMGLKYHFDFTKRIPRDEMDQHNELIENVINEINPEIKFKITGSYRRGCATSGDIDVLITHKIRVLGPLINALKEKKYLVDDFAFGDKKYNGVCVLPDKGIYRRIDIMYTDEQRYPFALLYFTGSQQFNIAMRNRALELGYSLNEYGLKKEGTDENVDRDFMSEMDVFKFLGIKYKAPKNRNTNELYLKTPE